MALYSAGAVGVDIRPDTDRFSTRNCILVTLRSPLM